MAVPDFESLMLPLLKLAADGQPHSLGQAREALAVQFGQAFGIAGLAVRYSG